MTWQLFDDMPCALFGGRYAKHLCQAVVWLSLGLFSKHKFSGVQTKDSPTLPFRIQLQLSGQQLVFWAVFWAQNGHSP